MSKATTLPPQTEKEFMAQVTELAKTLGWHVYHPFYSIRSERGWPDLSMVRAGRLVFAELKTDKGKLTPQQLFWIAQLDNTVAEAHVWRPADWDQICEVLR